MMREEYNTEREWILVASRPILGKIVEVKTGFGGYFLGYTFIKQDGSIGWMVDSGRGEYTLHDYVTSWRYLVMIWEVQSRFVVEVLTKEVLGLL